VTSSDSLLPLTGGGQGEGAGVVSVGQLEDLSIGGAGAAGVPAMQAGGRGQLLVASIEVPLPFVVCRFDETDVPHLAFELDARAEAALHRRLDVLPQAA
jgi:hypothetical protein